MVTQRHWRCVASQSTMKRIGSIGPPAGGLDGRTVRKEANLRYGYIGINNINSNSCI